MDAANLAGKTILVVEEQPLIALDLQITLKQANAKAFIARNPEEALTRISQFDFAAGVIEWRPQSDQYRRIARALKKKGARFVFYATHPPEDVTTARGAPIFIKPERPEKIVAALARLVGAE